MATEFWLWSGVDAIDDLEECTDFAQALEALAERSRGGCDCTLWTRDDTPATCRALLLAVATAGSAPLVLRYPVGQLVAVGRLAPGQVLRVVRGPHAGRRGRLLGWDRGQALLAGPPSVVSVGADEIIPEPGGPVPRPAPDDTVPAAAPGTCKWVVKGPGGPVGLCGKACAPGETLCPEHVAARESFSRFRREECRAPELPPEQEQQNWPPGYDLGGGD